MDIWISIVVTFVLVLVNGYFSMSEMALVNARHVLLQHDADEGDKSAQRALGLAADSGQFLATIQVAITLVGFFASAAAATNLSDPLAQWLSGFNIGWLSVIAPGLAPVVITLIVSYLSIVVGSWCRNASRWPMPSASARWWPDRSWCSRKSLRLWWR